MRGFVPPALTIAQCVVAGAIAGLCMLHLGWWRGELRRAGAAWSLALTAVLAAVCLTNGLLWFLPLGVGADILLVLRYVTFATAVVVTLPAARAYTGGPAVRRLVIAIAGWYAVGGLMWATTDLVGVVGRDPAGLPLYGPFSAAVELLPLVAVGGYVATSVRSKPLGLVGAVVTVAGFLSCVMVIVASVPPPSVLTELLRGIWGLPLVGALQLLATTRIAAVRGEALGRERMRDALARVANAAWYLHTPEQVLDRAQEECREVLHDPTITGTLRPLATDRFVTEFETDLARDQGPDERAFLRDVARVVSSAAERQALTDRLNRAAFTDTLTELENRHAFERHLRRVLDRASVEQTRVALLFCDVDGLRHVNDRGGHAAGDRVLVETADYLRRATPDTAYVARHGGDEFVVLLERAGAPVDVVTLARRLRAEFAVDSHGGVGLALTVGVATWEPRDVVDVDALQRDADLAMLEAKRSHSGVTVCDAALRAKVASQTRLRRELEEGLGDDEIVAYFQPLTHAVTLEVIGLEVLARWARDGEVRCPSQWMTFAEESGLIVEVGQQMFRAARTGMEEFDLPVAVNVAARQLDEPDFVAQVEQSWGTDAWDRLTIEVTESALLYDAVHVRTTLETLAARGVRIAIDDFGTGYSSFARLGELPLHVLKIDRTFVQGVRAPEGAAVLRAIIALAAAHGLEVVAEGVEHADELTALVEMGVGTVQGHMLGRPRPSAPVRGSREVSARTFPAAVHLEAVRRARPVTPS